MNATKPRKRAPTSITANLKEAENLKIYGRLYSDYTKKELAAFIVWMNQKITEAYEKPNIALRRE